ncbi:pyridoxal phosphate-dependent transferase [Naematelia encephala]|uniref:Pyridoxal phosphate-dependent transferase n=1 Tax=Naematelia encephala TaxID=71784 RepID=A0A1Y2B3N3_9TREE|nr:pyridoxal phosphate-dependent transferase [Naematelia encephala]
MPDIDLIAAQEANHAGPSKGKPAKSAKAWNIRASPAVGRSRNPIRATLATLTTVKPTTTKSLINLGIGDPTHYPLHPPPPAATSSVRDAVISERANGYVPGAGMVSAREAVAEYHSRWDGVKYGIDDIVLTHGVGQALDLVFSILFPHQLAERSNILLPRPGFALYATLLANLNVEVRYYDCLEEQGWEVDLDMLESLCDDDTRAIMITNPSNPCGSNFTESHLRDILDIAEANRVPIIADEIYGHMTWTRPFIPLAALSTSVPILTLSGLSKRFLLPGWRFGWVALHDPLGVAAPIKEGLGVWANRFFGPCSLTQASLPDILQTESQWFDDVLAKVRANADVIYSAINETPGLSCSKPEGALYILVRIDQTAFPQFVDEVDFCTTLLREEAVFVMPGLCFETPGYFRVVIASPADIMHEVGERLKEFSSRHCRQLF